jgi:hypothetical protein
MEKILQIQQFALEMELVILQTPALVIQVTPEIIAN